MQTPVFDGVVYDHSNQYEQDNRLYVQFFVEAVQNNFKTEQQKRPIFDEIEMVRIFTPGSRDVMVGKATLNYQLRFPKQYAAFKAGKDLPLEGTPLEEVPFLSVGQVAELKALNIRTLEGLAYMSDAMAQQVMGNFALRQKAQQLIAANKESEPAEKLAAELKTRDEQIAEMQKAMAEQQEQITKLLAAAAAKPDTAKAPAPPAPAAPKAAATPARS